MKKLLQVCLLISLSLCHGFLGAENIVVSLVTPSAAYMDHFVAIEKGYFREQNLNVGYIRAGRRNSDPGFDVRRASFEHVGGIAVLRDEIATRAELTKLSNPPDKEKLFDYSIVRKIYAELKASGWQPKP